MGCFVRVEGGKVGCEGGCGHAGRGGCGAFALAFHEKWKF